MQCARPSRYAIGGAGWSHCLAVAFTTAVAYSTSLEGPERGNMWKPGRSMQISQQNMENMESGGLSEGNLNLVGHCILELTGGCDQVETFTAQHLGCIDQNLLVRWGTNCKTKQQTSHGFNQNNWLVLVLWCLFLSILSIYWDILSIRSQGPKECNAQFCL